MKIAPIITGLLLLAIGMLLMDRMLYQPTTTVITVLWDITDTTIGKPLSDEIIRLYHLEEADKWNGAVFRLSTISNVNFNPTQELRVPIREKWLSNELAREKEIRAFKSQIAYLVDSPQGIMVGQPNSSVYWPLFAELKRLAEQNGERRVMVIQSDLMENNRDLSLYDNSSFKAFTQDPKSIQFLTDNLEQMPSLKGIEVYLLYRPSNAPDSYRYTLISEVVKSLLQEKGAKVYRSANLSS